MPVAPATPGVVGEPSSLLEQANSPTATTGHPKHTHCRHRLRIRKSSHENPAP
jgi:hypothetical protein